MSTSRLPILAALGAAVAASACCTLPLALAAVGVGGAFASSLTALEPLRPLFIVLAVGTLGLAFWRSSRTPLRAARAETAKGSDVDCACDDEPVGRGRRTLLIAAAVAVGALLLSPTLLGLATTNSEPLPGSEPSSFVALTGSADTSEVVLRVEGMTCASCARGLEATLRRAPGVLAATVTMEPPEARLSYDAASTSPQALVEAVEATGYSATLAPGPPNLDIEDQR